MLSVLMYCIVEDKWSRLAKTFRHGCKCLWSFKFSIVHINRCLGTQTYNIPAFPSSASVGVSKYLCSLLLNIFLQLLQMQLLVRVEALQWSHTVTNTRVCMVDTKFVNLLYIAANAWYKKLCIQAYIHECWHEQSPHSMQLWPTQVAIQLWTHCAQIEEFLNRGHLQVSILLVEPHQSSCVWMHGSQREMHSWSWAWNCNLALEANFPVTVPTIIVSSPLSHCECISWSSPRICSHWAWNSVISQYRTEKLCRHTHYDLFLFQSHPDLLMLKLPAPPLVPAER